eukprot:TRINITY_DN6262_c0_g1_i5.p1 TRINITY_DN6262_c0_g1~~TRINITY_DN6262_c0_g1_i5.p1  ORF type:complete len:452 (+),score=65.12 TRINITY_DN6262_c0_g1_i5:37-1392(+)
MQPLPTYPGFPVAQPPQQLAQSMILQPRLTIPYQVISTQVVTYPNFSTQYAQLQPSQQSLYPSFTKSMQLEKVPQPNPAPPPRALPNPAPPPRALPTKTESLETLSFLNFENNCYMNAVLQALINTPEFLAEIMRYNLQSTGKNFELLVETINLAKRSAAKREEADFFDPLLIKRAIEESRPGYKGSLHQDAQEFLRDYLELLHEALSRGEDGSSIFTSIFGPQAKASGAQAQGILDSKYEAWITATLAKNNSPIYDLFAGNLASTVICQKCKRQTLTFEPFLDISLAFPEVKGKTLVPSVSDLMANFFNCEKFDGFICQSCGTQGSASLTKRLLWTPNVLVLHLKRFKDAVVKLENSVYIPEKLDLTNYLEKECSLYLQNIRSGVEYKLYAVVHHEGTLASGHYTAELIGRKGQWLEANDHEITTKQAPPNYSNKAYLLFYSRISRKTSP